MIPVKPAPKPPDFDRKVRQPGLSAIAELVGEPPLIKRPGRRRKKIAERREEIPAENFPPFWREALDDMMERYPMFGVKKPGPAGPARKNLYFSRLFAWSEVSPTPKA
ncbi:MAG: hypothetical protein ACLQGP_12960, partial [Isosphaeraceae bacterium]